MQVVATAGHVDHGKSTLVRALTGMEPDRWDEERRRGLTIDLGFAWTVLGSGQPVAFVDVPGHERFVGNMLAGLGPAPVVCFVVAADEGWQAQSSEHRDAIAALGIRYGVVVLTRSDKASDARVRAVRDEVAAELAGTGLRDAPVVVVSAADRTGLERLRAVLNDVVAAVPAPDPGARVRLWVDRSFSVVGAGTVVTGTLVAGTIGRGDRLDVHGADSINPRPTVVRGLQSRGKPYPMLRPVDRVAVNLRGIAHAGVRRGDVLVTPGAWPVSALLDVRRVTGPPFGGSSRRFTVHVGTAAVTARLRPLDDDHGRLTLDRALPLVLGDRLIIRDPGSRLLAGAVVLDADPPSLRRRGAGTRRAVELAPMTIAGDVAQEVSRRGAVRKHDLARLGLVATDTAAPGGVREVGAWWVHRPVYDAWKRRLHDLVHLAHESDPLSAGISRGAARDALRLPDEALLDPLARDTGLEQRDGQLRPRGTASVLGPAEAAVTELAERLTQRPFAAPEADDLDRLQLDVRALAAAERAGRLLRLGGGIVLLPTAPELAVRELARLRQPFTTSQARQALHTTRRVAIPLLEHLDARGWTRRLDVAHREVTRRLERAD